MVESKIKMTVSYYYELVEYKINTGECYKIDDCEK